MRSLAQNPLPGVAVIAIAGALFAAFYMTNSDDPVSASVPSKQAPEQLASPTARPNFLLIISDDQSWEHTSFAGYPLVRTPNFDRIAREGIYFTNTYAATPTCTGSRSAILAGQPVWRLGSASMLYSRYNEQMISYQHILGEAGYTVGYSGKGWGPGEIPPELGLRLPPTGAMFNELKRPVGSHLGSTDLAANFARFLDESAPGQPFSFWAGSKEPHRPYSAGVNRFNSSDDARHIPPFLPNTSRVQSELSSYLDEVEIFDRDVGALMAILQERELLDNTVVIVTSDNGMPFSRAKTNNYQHGVRVPLAVRWGRGIYPGRTVEDFINLTDLAPTMLELAGVTTPKVMTASSFAYALHSKESGLIDGNRKQAFTAFERHSGFIRKGQENLTYPRRAIHTQQFLYIKNHFPERWPAGDPPAHVEAYTKLLKDPDSRLPLSPYYELATAKRPAEELYDLKVDPGQLTNLAQRASHTQIKSALRDRLREELLRTRDPLEVSGKDVFQNYGYFAPPRNCQKTKGSPC